MTAPRDGDDGDSETAFALIMLGVSVIVFLAVRNDEKHRSGPPR